MSIMDQYEYETFRKQGNNSDETIKDFLNGLGKEGWKVVYLNLTFEDQGMWPTILHVYVVCCRKLISGPYR